MNQVASKSPLAQLPTLPSVLTENQGYAIKKKRIPASRSNEPELRIQYAGEVGHAMAISDCGKTSPNYGGNHRIVQDLPALPVSSMQ